MSVKSRSKTLKPGELIGQSNSFGTNTDHVTSIRSTLITITYDRDEIKSYAITGKELTIQEKQIEPPMMGMSY